MKPLHILTILLFVLVNYAAIAKPLQAAKDPETRSLARRANDTYEEGYDQGEYDAINYGYDKNYHGSGDDYWEGYRDGYFAGEAQARKDKEKSHANGAAEEEDEEESSSEEGSEDGGGTATEDGAQPRATNKP